MVARKDVVGMGVGAGAEPVGTEGGRRPTGVPTGSAAAVDPEVVARPKRRRLSVAYKLKVLDTVSVLRGQAQGAVGAYLRKEGLYYSSVRSWERQRSQGLLTARNRGPRERSREALLAENKHLRRKLEHTEARLAKTEMIVDLQKKLSRFMEMETRRPAEKSAAA